MSTMSNYRGVLLFLVFVSVALANGEILDKKQSNRKTFKPKENDLKPQKVDYSPASVLTQLDWRSIFTTAVKMFLSNGAEESQLASRQMVNIILNLIDSLRLSFSMKQAQSRSIAEPEEEGLVPTTDAALAGLSMLKAYVKTITATDDQCVKKYLCQANREAVKDGNKVGFMIAQLGSYATSYMLENFRRFPFANNFEASKDGRNGANCEVIYRKCREM